MVDGFCRDAQGIAVHMLPHSRRGDPVAEAKVTALGAGGSVQNKLVL